MRFWRGKRDCPNLRKQRQAPHLGRNKTRRQHRSHFSALPFWRRCLCHRRIFPRTDHGIVCTSSACELVQHDMNYSVAQVGMPMAKCIFPLKDPVTDNSHDLGKRCLASRVGGKRCIDSACVQEYRLVGRQDVAGKDRKETLWAENVAYG